MTLPLWSKETRPPLVHTPFVPMKKLSLRDSLLSITTIMNSIIMLNLFRITYIL